MILFLLLLSAPICFFEGLPLIREKRWKEFWAFASLIGIALLTGIGKAAGWPTPIELLYRLLLPVGKILFKDF
jgi:hypothetical protein